MPPVNQLNAIDAALALLAGGRNRDPFAVLGPHRDNGDTVIRAFHPYARSIELRLLPSGDLRAMQRRGSAGVFELRVTREHGREADAPYAAPDYRLRITFPGDHVVEIDDPYRYGRVLTDFDLHLLGEGTHLHAFEKLGAHQITVGSATGTHFAVWAPNADRVSVIGDFNGWDGRVHPMRLIVPGGVWEIFIPNLGDGEKYKFEIRARNGALLTKSDPFAVSFETPPRSASVVHDISRYTWGDADWLQRRAD